MDLLLRIFFGSFAFFLARSSCYGEVLKPENTSVLLNSKAQFVARCANQYRISYQIDWPGLETGIERYFRQLTEDRYIGVHVVNAASDYNGTAITFVCQDSDGEQYDTALIFHLNLEDAPRMLSMLQNTRCENFQANGESPVEIGCSHVEREESDPKVCIFLPPPFGFNKNYSLDYRGLLSLWGTNYVRVRHYECVARSSLGVVHRELWLYDDETMMNGDTIINNFSRTSVLFCSVTVIVTVPLAIVVLIVCCWRRRKRRLEEESRSRGIEMETLRNDPVE